MDRVEYEITTPTVAETAHRSHGTVLIVGVDESMRAVVRRMLERRGFDAREASNADEALARMGSRGDAIAGAVLDLGMHARVAEEAFACLRLTRADLPILVIGGYGEEILMARLVGAPDTDFLPKPFGLDALGAKADGLFSVR